MSSHMAQEVLRAVLLSLQRHMDAADLLPVIDHEREFLASLIDGASGDERQDADKSEPHGRLVNVGI